MDTSFYTAAVAAKYQQQKIDVIANNISNINTTGYKQKNAVFSDLMRYNLRDIETEQTSLQAGSGAIVSRTDTNFSQGTLQLTGIDTQYAISGRGFFMLQDPTTEAITYTRDGTFAWSVREDGIYLVNTAGKLVLDENQVPITKATETQRMGRSGGDMPENEPNRVPGVFTLPIERGLENIGNNEYRASEANGQPVVAQDYDLHKGYVEMSNSNLADEMAKTIESSRAYSYVLKMLQTADEVEQTINSLR